MNLVGNIAATLSGRLMVLALALVSSIVLARGLGPEGRGVVALILLLPDLVMVFGHLGMQEANAVYSGLEPEGRRLLVWQSALAGGVVGGGIVFGAACFLVAGAPGFEWLVRGPLWLYLVALLLVPAELISSYWSAILRGMNRIVLLNALEVGAKAASLILLLAFIVWFRLGVVGVVLANVLVVVGTAAIMVAVLRHMGAWGRPSFDRSFCRRTGRFALSAYVGMIMTYLNYRFDQFIIAAFLPPEQLGFYVISVGLAERLWVLPGSVGTALLPHLTNSGQRDAAISATVARHIMAWMGLCCLLVFVLAEVIVTGLYSTAFGPAVAPLRWLLPGIFTLTAGKVLVAELLAREKIRYTVWAGVTSVLANVVGNLLLVPRMGIAGAALASSISYTVVSLMVSWYYVRETGLPWSSFLPRRSDLETYRTLWRRGSGLAALLGRAS